MRVVAAPSWAELAHHALAHVDARDPSSLYDPRYLAWARESLPEDVWRPLAEDSEVLGRAYRDVAPRAWALSGLAVAFDDGGRFVTAARSGDVAGWDDAVFDEPSYGAPLRSLAREAPALVEVLVADLRLVLPAWTRHWETTVLPALEGCRDAVSGWAERVGERAGAMRDATLWLSCPLGVRGRAFGKQRLCAGAPLPWNGLPPSHAAMQWLHERAVTEAGGGYLDAESLAWRAVTELLRGTPLEAEHRGWQGRYDARAIERHAATLSKNAVGTLVERLLRLPDAGPQP